MQVLRAGSILAPGRHISSARRVPTFLLSSQLNNDLSASRSHKAILGGTFSIALVYNSSDIRIANAFHLQCLVFVKKVY